MTTLLFELSSTQSREGRLHGGGEHALATLSALADHPAAAAHRWFGTRIPHLPLDQRCEDLISKLGMTLVDLPTRKSLTRVAAETRAQRIYLGLPYSFGRAAMPNAHVVMTIHGLRTLECPFDDREAYFAGSAWDRLKRRLWPVSYQQQELGRLRRLLSVNSAGRTIVVPSVHTLATLRLFAPDVRVEDIRVLASPRKLAAPCSPTPVPDRPYVLVVSGDRWLKNARRAVEAMDLIYRMRPDIALDTVITGGLGTGICTGVRNPERFHLRGYLPPGELEELYRRAFCLLYPTLNEGFGYPPLEAMAHGTPVVAAAVASVSEVCGDGALYCQPFNLLEMASRIVTLYDLPEFRLVLATRGRARAEAMARTQDADLARLADLIIG